MYKYLVVLIVIASRDTPASIAEREALIYVYLQSTILREIYFLRVVCTKETKSTNVRKSKTCKRIRRSDIYC